MHTLVERIEEALEGLLAGARGASNLDRLQHDSFDASGCPSVKRGDVRLLTGTPPRKQLCGLGKRQQLLLAEVDAHWLGSGRSRTRSSFTIEPPGVVARRATMEQNGRKDGERKDDPLVGKTMEQ